MIDKKKKGEEECKKENAFSKSCEIFQEKKKNKCLEVSK